MPFGHHLRLGRAAKGPSDETIPLAEDEAPPTLSLANIDDSEGGLWQQAWDSVKQELPDRFVEAFKQLHSGSVMTEVKDVISEAYQRSKSLEKKQRKIPGTNRTYREVFGKITDYAHKFEAVGDFVAQVEPMYASLPWACLKLFIQMSIGEHETYNLMLSTSELIADIITRYPVIEQTYARLDSDLSAALRNSLLELYKTIVLFQGHAFQFFDPDHKLRRTWDSINPAKAGQFKGRKAAIEVAAKTADRDIGFVNAEVTKTGVDNILVGQSDQNKQLEQIKDGMRALSSESKAMIDKQNAILSEADTQRAQQLTAIVQMWKGPLDKQMDELEKTNLASVRKWLSGAKPENDLSKAESGRPLELGGWLIGHPKFGDWENADKSSILWLCGFAGTGKTGLVCHVLKHLRRSQQSARLAFFFFSSDQGGRSGGHTARSDPNEALRSIVSQICTAQQGRRVEDIVQTQYEQLGPNSDNQRALTDFECVEILIEVSQHCPITIVLDALDEADRETSPEMIQNLKLAMSQSLGKIKIFCSTRLFPAVEGILEEADSIEVTKDVNGKDVRIFIARTLEGSSVPRALRPEVEDILSQRAGNMFLYASLLLDRICDKNHTDDEFSIRRKLQELPTDLAEAYNEIIDEIHDERNNSERSCLIAQSTLKWLLYAQMPLDSETMLEAIIVPGKRVSVDEVISACRTLVRKANGDFEFSHYSVREHVRQLSAYSPSQCHLMAATACMAKLNAAKRADVEKGTSAASQRNFEQYAILYWPVHLEGISRDDRQEHRSEINELFRAFLHVRGQNNKYQDWLSQALKKAKALKETQYDIQKLEALQASPPSPLFAACIFGLGDLVGRFGRELGQLNKYNNQGQSALCLAIENDNLDTVEALLNSRFPADVNILNVKAVHQFEDWDAAKPSEVIIYASPLQAAAAQGRVEVAEYLVSRGAHVDLVAGYYGSPLQAAALGGHGHTVQLLLKHGAEPNSQGGFHGNALQAAAARGHVHIVNILLDNKPAAIVDVPGGHYGFPLFAAICSKNPEIVVALLDEKANPSIRSKIYGYPLEKAATLPSREMVKHLIDFGAWTDTSSTGEGVHILHWAAMYNMPELVNFCIGKCDVNMVTSRGPSYPRKYGDFPQRLTPLAYAAAEGHTEIVQLLLNGESHYTPREDPSAVLWVAAYRGHADVAELLIQRFKKEHPNESLIAFFDKRPDRSGHPIMFAAASSGSADVVSVLLDNGCPYRCNWYNASPLLATATFPAPDVTRRLLDYHAQGKVDVEINKRANNGRTALFEACALNRPRVLNHLLDANADVTIPADGPNLTCLMVSSLHDNFGLISAIVDKALKPMDEARRVRFINQGDRGGRTALSFCAERNRLAATKYLLSFGADWTLPGGLGATPLHWASRLGHVNIATEILNKAQANDSPSRPFRSFLDHRDKDGQTALWQAVRNDRRPVVQLLLEYGASYWTPNNIEVTPLHDACYAGQKEMVDILLNHASEDPDQDRFRKFLNYRNHHGKTALHDAAEKDRREIAETLLNHGIDYTIANGGNSTALHVATHNPRREIVAILLGHAFRASHNRDRSLRFLNHRNSQGKTALHDAGENDRPNIARMLLEHDIDYSICDNNDFTALHWCAYRGHINTVRTLLETINKSSAQPTDQRNVDSSINSMPEQDRIKFTRFLNQQGSSNGASVLHDVAKRINPRRNYAEIMMLLLRYGCEYETYDKRRQTPLSIAIERKDIDIVTILLAHATKHDGKGNREKLTRSLNTKAENGESTIDRVRKWGERGIVDRLKACGIMGF